MTSDPFAPSKPPPQEYLNAVDKLFDYWRKWFGAKVSDNERFDAINVILWADYLANANTNLDEMRAAFLISKTLDFPPQNAHDFLKLVRKHKYPYADKALTIACECASRSQYEQLGEQDWQFGVIYETAIRVGFAKLINEPIYSVGAKFEQVYRQVCQEADGGKVFIIPSVPLIEKKHIPASREFAKAVLDKLQGVNKMGCVV